MTTRLIDNDSVYKQQVATRFSRAAQSYDQYARFQEQVVRALSALLEIHQPECWLDVGTGTGNGLALLKSQSCAPDIVALDLSESMLQKARQRANVDALVCADAEQLPFQSCVFDGLFSSLAIQWCQRPQRLFSEMERVLKASGQVVLSTLLKGSMPELGRAWQQADGRTHHNHYCDLSVLLEQARAAGFEVQYAEQTTVTTWYPTVKEAVYSLKKVGASLLTSEAVPISPSTWKTFAACYEAQRQTNGIPLSYEVALIQLTKG